MNTIISQASSSQNAAQQHNLKDSNNNNTATVAAAQPPNNGLIASSFVASLWNEMKQFDIGWHQHFVDYIRLQQLSDYEKCTVKSFQNCTLLNTSQPLIVDSHSQTQLAVNGIVDFFKVCEQFEGVWEREKGKISSQFEAVSTRCLHQLRDIQHQIQSHPQLTSCAVPQSSPRKLSCNDNRQPVTPTHSTPVKVESGDKSSRLPSNDGTISSSGDTSSRRAIDSYLSPLSAAFYGLLEHCEPNKNYSLASTLADRFLSLVQLIDLLKRFIVLNTCALWRFLHIHKNCLKYISQLPIGKDEMNRAQMITQQWKKESEGYCNGVDSILRSVYESMTQFSAVDRGKLNLSNSNETLYFNWSSDETCSICRGELHLPVHLRCSHPFCFNCLVQQQTFGISCPICRTPHDNVQLDIDKVLRSLLAGKFHDLEKMKSKKRTQSKRRQDEDKFRSTNNSSLSVDPQAPTIEAPSLIWSSNSASSTDADSPLSGGSSTDASPYSSTTSTFKRWHGDSCHQCKTTKDPSTLLLCSTGAEKSGKKRRCRKKYCENCLRKSYNSDLCIPSANWVCPACQGICNCSLCNRGGSNCSTSGSSGGMDASISLPVQNIMPIPSILTSPQIQLPQHPGKLIHIPSDASSALLAAVESPFNRQVSFLSQLTNPWGNSSSLYLDRLPSTGSLNFLSSYNYDADSFNDMAFNSRKLSFPASSNQEARIDEQIELALSAD